MKHVHQIRRIPGGACPDCRVDRRSHAKTHPKSSENIRVNPDYYQLIRTCGKNGSREIEKS